MRRQQDSSFTISRRLEASAEEVFAKWMDPGLFAHIIGPAGSKMTFLSTDIREGGASRWAMRMEDGTTKYGLIRYKTILPNQLLAYVQNFCDERGAFIKAPFSESYPDYLLTTLKFTPADDLSSILTMKWEIYGDATAEERHTFEQFKPLMVQGWSDTFDKLEGVLGS